MTSLRVSRPSNVKYRLLKLRQIDLEEILVLLSSSEKVESIVPSPHF